MTVDECLGAALRERQAVNAGIAKAALWLDSEGKPHLARQMLEQFHLTPDDLRKADEVERIEHYGADLDDAIAILSN
jgi:hypothetical protein